MIEKNRISKQASTKQASKQNGQAASIQESKENTEESIENTEESDKHTEESKGHIGLIGVTCDSCSGPVCGFRYKCLKCDDYDLCEECEHSVNHTQNTMLRIPDPRHRDHEESGKRNKKIFVLNFIDFPSNVTVDGGIMKISRRDGACEDSQNLYLTFKSLGYEVVLHENKTSAETNHIINDIQRNKNLDFLLLFIASHGIDDDMLLTSDGLQLSLKSIQEKFIDSACPQLKGKRKVILANFCKGNNTEYIAPQQTDGKEIDQYESDAVELKEPPHNMITIFSSHEGFSSRRSSTKGTSFVQHLCTVLKDQPNLPITEVFNLIYRRMKPNEGQTPEMRISPPFKNFNFLNIDIE